MSPWGETGGVSNAHRVAALAGSLGTRDARSEASKADPTRRGVHNRCGDLCAVLRPMRGSPRWSRSDSPVTAARASLLSRRYIGRSLGLEASARPRRPVDALPLEAAVVLPGSGTLRRSPPARRLDLL